MFLFGLRWPNGLSTIFKMDRGYNFAPEHGQIQETVFVDEEQCLGPEVFATELELLCGNVKMNNGRYVCAIAA